MKIKETSYPSGLFSKQHIFIFISNIVYIASALLITYKYNPEFFFENACQVVNICFYLLVILSFFLIKSDKWYFLCSLFLVLDLPVSLKENLQNLLSHYLHISNTTVTYLLVFCVFGLVVLFVFRYRAVRYLQVYLLIFYFITLLIAFFKPVRMNDPSLRLGNQIAAVSKNYYFLLFDEYPNEQIIRDYHITAPGDYPSVLLSREGFKEDQHVYSNFTGTERSVTTFLTGNLQPEYNVNKAIRAIYENSFTGSRHYSFHAFSLFDNQNRPNSQFSALFFKDFNNLSTRKFIPFIISLFNKRGVGKYTDWNDYNAGAISWLSTISQSKRPHVVYIHFYTPHFYPLVWGQSLPGRIKNANGWMQKAIETIDQHDKSAGVIVFSDHGLRLPMIPYKAWNRNMLYFRNVQIDTSLVNKNGLVDLTKSIKF